MFNEMSCGNLQSMLLSAREEPLNCNEHVLVKVTKTVPISARNYFTVWWVLSGPQS
jgi:hypothetical protein